MTFLDFFTTATGNPDKPPYDYQSRLAGNNSRTVCRSQLIDIPTGLGKTAAVVLAWLWNRFHHQSPAWPRRLIYCLPMRTLVDQTQAEVKKWLENLLKEHSKLRIEGQSLKDLEWLAINSPIILMGGEAANESDKWDIHPERPTILIGTQDMLLSRALNRGYGTNRYRWPMHFALLNNDCFWIMDETQLMGVGVETSAQLDAFRHDRKMPTIGACPTWWMSATLEHTRLATVDHPKPEGGWPTEKLSEAEQTAGQPHKLITAPKKLSPASWLDEEVPLVLNPSTKNDYPKRLAALIAQRHQPGTLTLVIVNRVSRAREIYQALTTPSKGKPAPHDPPKIALIHSRFRPKDRKKHTDILLGDPNTESDRIVIATQAVEAGVDVSARLLITELAPWSSLVQRIGRCNRRAEFTDAEVLWVNIEPDAKGELLLPYTQEELDTARAAITPLTNASPQALSQVTPPPLANPIIRPVIRRRDLIDLFDTTPDLCGQDLDISRYIRDGDDNDVQFFWRTVEEPAPNDKISPPQRDELCRVSIGDAAKFLDKKPRAWCWNPLTEHWDEARTARPGAVYLLDVKSGGYSDITGWTGETKDKPTPHPSAGGQLPRYAGDRRTFIGEWQTLTDHTAQVILETDKLTQALSLDNTLATVLHTAALWHDIGKAHDEFQAMLIGDNTSLKSKLWAKSDHMKGRCHRCGFRHELASALAWLIAGPLDATERDLVAYLIAAHHGKVRLSIRSMPNEPAPEPMPNGEDRLFARGIWQQDKLPSINLGEFTTPEITLDLGYMQMGENEKRGPSWLARMVALRDRLGPFQLAFLETLLRAADAHASRKPTT